MSKEDFAALVSFLGFTLVVWCISRLWKPKKKENLNNPSAAPKDWSGVRDLEFADFNDVYIAGLAHHCTPKDVGCFAGWIVHEKGNPYDKNAMMVVNPAKRCIGYVPKTVLEGYREWCGGKDCPCVGAIFLEDGTLRGRVRAYHPDRCNSQEYEKDATGYFQRACEKYSLDMPDLA